MHASKHGKTWVVRERKHVFGRHKSRRRALTQEGAVHLHLRQHGKEYKRGRKSRRRKRR